MKKTTNKTNKISTIGLNRKTIDKFYTSQHIANQCIEYIKQTIHIQKDDLCIEPSAGNGSFMNGIKSLTGHNIFYDLEPEHVEITQQDYLTFDYQTVSQEKYRKIHVIGNPPFGRQSSLAIQFIKKSVEYCDSISFILPKSFKKDSLKKHFPLHFHLEYEYDLPNNSFTVDNKSHDVPCVFQIWVKKESNRPIPKKLVPNQYTFVKKQNPHDISFRRVGVYAGEIDRNTENKSEQSHYFIQFNDTLSDQLFNDLSKIEYESKHNTVGPKSISKQELIKEFNQLLI